MNTRPFRIAAIVAAIVEKGLEEAKAKGWTVVDMKQNWKVIFPAKKK